MSSKHTLKNSLQEAVFKCYLTGSSGGVVDISLEDDVCQASETFDASEVSVTIQEIYWGAKKDKQIDITRITDAGANTVHGHYYLHDVGHYDFVGFVDDVYSSKDIRIDIDGPGHVIIKLRKVSGFTPT